MPGILLETVMLLNHISSVATDDRAIMVFQSRGTTGGLNESRHPAQAVAKLAVEYTHRTGVTLLHMQLNQSHPFLMCFV